MQRTRLFFPWFTACLAGAVLTLPAYARLDLHNARVLELDNGLTVIVLEDRNFPVASVQMLYRVGGRKEGPGITGIAHFVEHMAFRATENFPGTEVVQSIYARGGEWHGYTWTDNTTYFATVPRDDVDLLLRIEADRMGRLRMSPEVLEQERRIVMTEMRQYENLPSSMLIDALMYTSFLTHPYRNNTIGVDSDILGMKFGEIEAFYRAHYYPANAVLAVVGDINAEAIIARVQALFGDFERRPVTPLPRTREAPQVGERRVRITGSSDSHELAIAYRAPSVSHADYAAFLVLQEVLGAGSGAHLVQDDWGVPVGDDGLLAGAANELTTWFPPSAQDYAFFIAGRRPEHMNEAETEAAIESRVDTLRSVIQDEAVIERAIADVRDELVYDVATTEDAAHQLAYFAGIGALDVLLTLPERVTAVTAADVQRVAQTYLRATQRTIAWYEPREMLPALRNAESRPAPALRPSSPVDESPVAPPEVHWLAGGIPVVIQVSDLSPSAWLQIVVPGANVDGSNAESNVPIRGYSAYRYRLRPERLEAVITEAVADLHDSRYVVTEDADLSGDPETRLEQVFDAMMLAGTSGSESSVAPAVIVLTGDVDQDTALTLLEASFGSQQMRRLPATPAPAVTAKEEWISLGAAVAQASVGYIVKAPGPSDAAYDATRLLLYIFSHDYEGRLGAEAIAARGLAYYIGSSYRSDGANGWITISSGVNSQNLAAFGQIFSAELQRLESEPPTEAEIAEAKAWHLGRAISAAQSNAELAGKIASQWLLYGRTESVVDQQARLASVSHEDVIAAIPAFVNGTVIVIDE